MKAQKFDSFSDRQKKAAEAKQTLIERFRAMPGPDDPVVQARMAAQVAQAEARAARAAEREAIRAAEAAKRAEE